jgi:DNA-binding transcriptional MerR regulator
MTVAHLPTHRVEEDCPPGHITSLQLVMRAGITYRQLDYWTRTDLLRPTDQTHAKGSGTARYYPVDQVHRAATIRWLLDAGISLQAIRAAIDELLATGAVRLVDGLVIHLPEDI